MPITVREEIKIRLRAKLSSQLTRLLDHRVWGLFGAYNGIWPKIWNYGWVEETARRVRESFEDETRALDAGQDEDADDGDEDDEDDHDDSGYMNDDTGANDEPHSELDIKVRDDISLAAFEEFLKLLFEVCLTLCTETFSDGQPGSTLLVCFSGILGLSGDCRQFSLTR